ncbi:hypothetical protein IWQ56_003782 [Coemansia nantahalensis]|uniref:Uncharacterized protein n=2 Tax=Coemansia TaxID=4863 RepID=A0ACC1KVB7_9FUNG|nr:hypothetical protein IWQ57_005409 [Coemansia nantahalensis]KAJ2766272.1 hypothetical protein IWQ56_003782 [Coemansia nantahalensis]KAJ2795280.1 hypothetical protein H4R21_005172 [Coemansia helicoidea]
MSFELTPQEQARVQLAQLAGVKLDPIGYGDLAMIVVLSTIYLFNFVAAGFLVWNRSYPPLKSKYPFLMASCILAMFMWFLGDLVLKSHVHVRGPLLSNCMLFCVWLRVVFGCYTVSVLISIRSYALFCIFRKSRAFRGRRMLVASGVVVLVAVVFIIVTYALPQSSVITYVSPIEMCDMSYTYRAVTQGLLWFTWIINAAINFRLRNITSSFNESREMAVACGTVFMLLTFNTGILYVYPRYPTQLSLRIAETMMSHALPNFLWWFIMCKSMYHCAFRRDQYLVAWKNKLLRDGLQKQYQMTRADPFNVTMVSVASNLGKMVAIPRAMVTDHDGFDAHTSFSVHSVDSRRSPGKGYATDDTHHQSSWRHSTSKPHCVSALSSDEQLDNADAYIMFSPRHAGRTTAAADLPRPRVEGSSTSSTVNDHATASFSQYNFPAPPK